MEERDDVIEMDGIVPDPTDDQIAAIVDEERLNKTEESSTKDSRQINEEHAKRALKAAADEARSSSSHKRTAGLPPVVIETRKSSTQSLPGTPLATESKEGGGSFFAFPWSGKSTAGESAE